jgi:hypothetical protein
MAHRLLYNRGMRRVLGLVVCVLVVSPSLAMAHGRMMVPLNRSKATDASNTDQDGGLCGGATCNSITAGTNAGVCGGVAKPAAATNSYVAGSTLNMTIETTIPHTGSTAGMEEYDFYWSATGDSLTNLFTGTGTAPTALKKIMFAKPAAAQTNNVTLTLPTTPATNGTLQMVMVNDDSATVYYMSCVDITLTAAVTTDGSVAPADAAEPVTEDLSAAGDLGPEDLSGVEPVSTDMARQPNAPKAGLACSMTPGSSPESNATMMLALLMLAFFARRAFAPARRS